jgi:predicted nucleotidyltransferase
MIREGKKLPEDILEDLPTLIQKVAEDPDVAALYAFGSLAEGSLKPLSDLDFGVLLREGLDKREQFQKCLDLLGLFNETFKTDKIDLVILDDAPLRFAYHIVKTGKRLYCRDPQRLIDFSETTTKRYFDFKPVREEFDRGFLEGIGYHG